MPANTSQQLYDLAPLVPLMEAGHLVLTPNLRLARRIKSEWDERQRRRGLQAWSPAPVQSLESWLLSCWQRALDAALVPCRVRLDGMQAQELWRQVIDADLRGNPDLQLLHSGSAADLAQQARDTLLRWRVSLDAAVRSQFALDPDCATFARWLDAFGQRLDDAALATAADCLADLLHSDFSPGVDEVTLVDFDEIQPLHAACLEKLVGSVDRRASACRESIFKVCSYPDSEAELAAMARWAGRRYREHPTETTGILLADMNADRGRVEYLLRREFDCLGENYTALPVNFSTGISLDHAPVIRDALRILRTLEDELPMSEVIGLFTSRFLPRREVDEPAVVQIMRRLFEDGSQRVATARLRSLAQTVSTGEERRGVLAGEMLRETDRLRLRRQRHTPSGWVDPFCQVLEIWGWPGEAPLDSLEYQQVEHFYSTLESFAALDGIFGAVDCAEALALLQRHCQGQVSQPQTADSKVQVLGPLEGAGLQFDAIWICGLQASRWPAPPRPNPFIPLSLQRRWDMPHASAEREWRFAETLLGQYRSSCGEMLASYARQSDGVPELPSPLLAGERIEHMEEPAELPLQWQELQARGRIESLADRTGPGVGTAERDTLTGGSGVLLDQANCAFRAFVRHRLKVQPLEDYHAGLSAAQRGSLLHAALFILWGQVEDSTTLQRMDALAEANAIEAAVAGAIQELPAAVRQLAGMTCLELEGRRLANLLAEWLAVERARPAFSVAAREQEMHLSLQGLELRLRVDRVDELAGGATLLIDYKSGRNSIADWLGARPAQPQLPLYGLASDVDGIAFAQVRTRECKLTGLGEIDGVPGVSSEIGKAVKRVSAAEDWQALREDWRDNLERLAGEFIDGAADVEPLKGACAYCGLQSLCRVDVPGLEVPR